MSEEEFVHVRENSSDDDSSTQMVSLEELVDLSLCTPEPGAVNFNLLRILLMAVIHQLNLIDAKTDILDENILESHRIKTPIYRKPSPAGKPLLAGKSSAIDKKPLEVTQLKLIDTDKVPSEDDSESHPTQGLGEVNDGEAKMDHELGENEDKADSSTKEQKTLKQLSKERLLVSGKHFSINISKDESEKNTLEKLQERVDRLERQLDVTNGIMNDLPKLAESFASEEFMENLMTDDSKDTQHEPMDQENIDSESKLSSNNLDHPVDKEIISTQRKRKSSHPLQSAIRVAGLESELEGLKSKIEALENQNSRASRSSLATGLSGNLLTDADRRLLNDLQERHEVMSSFMDQFVHSLKLPGSQKTSENTTTSSSNEPEQDESQQSDSRGKESSNTSSTSQSGRSSKKGMFGSESHGQMSMLRRATGGLVTWKDLEDLFDELRSMSDENHKAKTSGTKHLLSRSRSFKGPPHLKSTFSDLTKILSKVAALEKKFAAIEQTLGPDNAEILIEQISIIKSAAKHVDEMKNKLGETSSRIEAHSGTSKMTSFDELESSVYETNASTSAMGSTLASYSDGRIGNEPSKMDVSHLKDWLKYNKMRIEQLETAIVSQSEQVKNFAESLGSQTVTLSEKLQRVDRELAGIMGRLAVAASKQGMTREGTVMIQSAHSKILALQGKIDALGTLSKNMIEDRSQIDSQITMLIRALEELGKSKVDRSTLDEMIESKADRATVEKKVSTWQFEQTCQEIGDGLELLLDKINTHESEWKHCLGETNKQVKNKLDRDELVPLRESIDIRLKKISLKLDRLIAEDEGPDAAATRRKVISDVRCLCCDTKTRISGHAGPQLPRLQSYPPPNNYSGRAPCSGDSRNLNFMGDTAVFRAQLHKQFNLAKYCATPKQQRSLSVKQGKKANRNESSGVYTVSLDTTKLSSSKSQKKPDATENAIPDDKNDGEVLDSSEVVETVAELDEQKPAIIDNQSNDYVSYGLDIRSAETIADKKDE